MTTLFAKNPTLVPETIDMSGPTLQTTTHRQGGRP